MSLPTYNFEFVAGETFTLEITYRDSAGAIVDLSSGYRVDIDGKSSADASGTLFAVDSTTTAVALDSVAPNIVLTLAPDVTGAIAAPASGVYDVKVTHETPTPDVVRYILGGKFNVLKAVTA